MIICIHICILYNTNNELLIFLIQVLYNCNIYIEVNG